ncbi:MAG: hypothetical protein R2788_22970 [Saprospiraceae bacterium]
MNGRALWRERKTTAQSQIERPTFNAANRRASIDVTILSKRSPIQMLTLALFSPSIVDYQITPSGPVDDYKHEHIPWYGYPL